MHPLFEYEILGRRQFLGKLGLGTAAMAHLLAGESPAAPQATAGATPGLPHFAPRARRVIFLFQSGGPSQMDLFDYKPQLERWHGTDLPESVRQGQRLTGMTATQERFPVARSIFRFTRHGKSGAWVSELLPHTAAMVDDLCFIKTIHTEAINHDPAVTFFQTGSQIAGRPSMGAWISYGLGALNQDLPAFVVMVSLRANRPDQPLYDRLWGSGFLPSKFKASNSVPRAIPYSTCPIPQACRPLPAAACWTTSPA